MNGEAIAYVIDGLSLVARQSGLLLIDLAPWVISGALIGAALKTVRRLPFARSLPSISPACAVPLAAVSGAASPLCTLGSVPVVAGLVSRGFPRAAGAAFLAASSMVTPQMVLMTAGALGLRMAILQATGGIVAGTLAGWAMAAFPSRGASLFRDPGDAVDGVPPTSKSFAAHFAGQLEYGLFWMVAGVVISQGFSVFAPAIVSSAAGLAGTGGGLFSATLGAIVSAPLYSCGGAALPVLAAIGERGASPGFLLAFLICGPATRFRSAAALGCYLRPKGLAIYFAFVVAFAGLFGWATSLFAAS